MSSDDDFEVASILPGFIRQATANLQPGNSLPPPKRRLRKRTHKSYVIPPLIDDEFLMEPPFPPARPASTLAARAPDPDDSLDGSYQQLTTFVTSKAGRLPISRRHRVPTPPPLPAALFSYVQPDRFPVWLLADAMVKSSPAYLERRPENAPVSPVAGHGSVLSLAGQSELAPSPSKHTSFRPTHRCDPPAYPIPRPALMVSPEAEVEHRREQFWAHYEYNDRAPHLQDHYIEKPPPPGEQWAELDIQHPDAIPAPTLSSRSAELFDVFRPTPVSKLRRAQRDREPTRSADQLASIPFGFSFMPQGYKGHRN